MTFGHLALASIAHDTLFKKTSLLFLTLAALGPDLTDKPLCLLFGCNSRGFGHTLLFFLILLCIGMVLVRRGKLSRTLLMAGALLWLSHLAADFLTGTYLFWPLMGPFPQMPPLSFWDKVEQWAQFYQRWNWQSLQTFLEIGAILTALILRKRRKRHQMAHNTANCSQQSS